MRSEAIVCVALGMLVIAGALPVAADDGASVLDSDLRQLHVSLDGAPHYYALTPEMGRVLLRRAPAPSEDDSDDDVLVVTDSAASRSARRVGRPRA